MNYYEHFLGNYTKKTGHLRMAGHGAYRLLLDHYYSTERPLPQAYAALYVICKAMARKEQETVREVADEFFPIASDGLRHNKKADQEIARAQKRISTSRENGRKRNPLGNPPGTRQDTQQQPGGYPTSNPTGPYGEASIPHTPYPKGGERSELPTPEARRPKTASPPLNRLDKAQGLATVASGIFPDNDERNHEPTDITTEAKRIA